MKNDKLNLRQKEIIKILTKSTVNNPITTSVIAKELSLSSRTVLREMPKIEEWLDENEFKFIKKPGVGLIIDENLDNQQLILELLEIEKIKKQYSKEDRKKIIVGELLIAREPLKLFYFTSQLRVSEGTLSRDLDEIYKWFKDFNINLIRKPGLGIYVEGEESNFRKALINLFYDSTTENELMYVFKEVKDKDIIDISENKILKFIDKSIIKSVEKVVSNLKDELDIELADNSYVGLIVHLSLAIQRILSNEKISIDEKILEELSKLYEFSISTKIIGALKKEFKIDIPKDEIGYVTMHLKGAKLRLDNKIDDSNEPKNIDIKQVAYNMITDIENEFGVYLRQDERLINDLTNHLVPAISRLKMGLNIRNPLLENIKENYSKEFQACYKACNILKNIANLSDIPESEIAYITMHIAAALEKNILDEKVRVIIACHTGIGTSRLLMSIIQKEFKNIEVLGTISSININSENLKEQKIDFIISTVELSIDYKYIRVNTIINNQDKRLIEDTIKKVLKKKKYERLIKKSNNIEEINQDSKIESIKLNRKSIESITNLGQSILYVINNVLLKEISKVNSIEELIKQSSFMFACNENIAKHIEYKLIERENISTTYLCNFNIMLLHCKISHIEGARFGYIRLNQVLNNDAKIIEGAIVELVSDQYMDIDTEIIGKINETLIETEDFIKILKEDSKDDIVRKITEILVNLYEQKTSRYLNM